MLFMVFGKVLLKQSMFNIKKSIMVKLSMNVSLLYVSNRIKISFVNHERCLTIRNCTELIYECVRSFNIAEPVMHRIIYILVAVHLLTKNGMTVTVYSLFLLHDQTNLLV